MSGGAPFQRPPTFPRKTCRVFYGYAWEELENNVGLFLNDFFLSALPRENAVAIRLHTGVLSHWAGNPLTRREENYSVGLFTI